MHNSENLEDKRALRREQKRRPRMRVHGQSLKNLAKSRGAERIHKVSKKTDS